MVAGKATNSVPRRRQNPLFSSNCQDCRLLTEARGQLTVSGGGARKSDKKTIIRMKGPAPCQRLLHAVKEPLTTTAIFSSAGL